jgi:hypothetical protein
MTGKKMDNGRPGSSVIRNKKQQFSFPNRPNPRDGGSKGYDSRFRTLNIALAALAIALAGSLAVAAKIADRDCTRLAGPGPWVSAPAWIADGLTDIRAQAYARCVGEARP